MGNAARRAPEHAVLVGVVLLEHLGREVEVVRLLRVLMNTLDDGRLAITTGLKVNVRICHHRLTGGVLAPDPRPAVFVCARIFRGSRSILIVAKFVRVWQVAGRSMRVPLKHVAVAVPKARPRWTMGASGILRVPRTEFDVIFRD